MDTFIGIGLTCNHGKWTNETNREEKERELLRGRKRVVVTNILSWLRLNVYKNGIVGHF